MEALINKDTLQVICTSRHVTCTYLAKNLKCPEEKIISWINTLDSLKPTFLQAKKIAKCLHVPFASLYMNPDDIPLHKLPRIRNYRTLLNNSFSDDSALNIAIYDLLQAKSLFLSLKADFNEPITVFSFQKSREHDNVLTWAQDIRTLFGLDLNEQFHITSLRKFYLYVRQKLEEKGIFIHCFSDVDLANARAVALYDNVTPVIGLNEKDRPPAKTFSMIHELTHILKKQSSACNEIYNTYTKNKEEIFCNAVAGEVLMPHYALEELLGKPNPEEPTSIEVITKLAKHFKVSREVTTRRLLDLGYLYPYTYTTYIDAFEQDIEREREERNLSKKDKNDHGIRRIPHREAIDRTSSELCKLYVRGYDAELFNKSDISRYLGIGHQHIDRFLREVSSWSN